MRATEGGPVVGPPPRALQHNPAKDKAKDHAQRDSDNAGDQEGVVKDIFTECGLAGVVHLYRRQQGWVGR